jgi:hypothetical protein
MQPELQKGTPISKEQAFEEVHMEQKVQAPEAVSEMHRVNLQQQDMMLGKQIERFVLNANAELIFENFRHLRANFMCPKIYRKTEWIKGKSG